MERFIKGDIVVIPFPFSDLSQSKRRPALVIAELEGNDIILVQITSEIIKDRYSVLIDNNDLESGQLKQKSNVRPNRIFTADKHIVIYKIGTLKPEIINRVIETLISILKN